MEQNTLPIHFEDRSGTEFERLTFAYVAGTKNWDNIKWIGQTGNDGGRDIWGNFQEQSYCYQCANYRKLTYRKAKEDIDKLVGKNTIPDHLILVCGGRVTPEINRKVIGYANSVQIQHTQIWTGVEFEELLRRDAPELIRRFVHGEAFPPSASELIILAAAFSTKSDSDLVDLLSECFDRPAFTTPFRHESNIPDFQKAIEDTIAVLNTGIHRFRDGTIIRTIPARHRISDQLLKTALAGITAKVVKMRDNFVDLVRQNQIQRCECTLPDCPIYTLSENACTVMDTSRQAIFDSFKEIKPNFSIKLE